MRLFVLLGRPGESGSAALARAVSRGKSRAGDGGAKEKQEPDEEPNNKLDDSRIGSVFIPPDLVAPITSGR